VIPLASMADLECTRCMAIDSRLFRASIQDRGRHLESNHGYCCTANRSSARDGSRTRYI